MNRCASQRNNNEITTIAAILPEPSTTKSNHSFCVQVTYSTVTAYGQAGHQKSVATMAS